MVKKLIIANWKMNPRTVSEAIRLAKSCDKNEVVIAPPFVFSEAVGKVIKKAVLGAQDIFWEDKGPYTGEVSYRQLESVGTKYVIIGHSERRAMGETDEIINKKAKFALAHGLRVILCVGEKSDVRRRGMAAAKKFVASQLERDLQGAISSKLKVSSLIIAYEPIWAIGTGKNETPKNASKIAGFIKELLVKSYKFKVRVLYGGSINSENAGSFLVSRDIDGLLVGGASLKTGEFNKIIKSA